MKKEFIYRIRMYSGFKGGPNYYYHADVITTHWKKALSAAMNDKVINWRQVDSYDTATEDYVEYEFLYPIQWENAKNPSYPKP